MKVRVDSERCNGHGMCAALAPEVYSINEDTGFNEMGEFDLDAAHREAAMRGVGGCPEHAISVLDGAAKAAAEDTAKV